MKCPKCNWVANHPNFLKNHIRNKCVSIRRKKSRADLNYVDWNKVKVE